MRALVLFVVVIAGCSKSAPDEPITTTTTTASAAPKSSPLTPEALTVDEVKPLLPTIDGARSLRELKVIATAVDGSICIDKADGTKKAADDLVDKLVAKGWESRSPRQTAEPNVVAIDARKRPYLLRASVIGGTSTDGGGADECNGKTQVKVSYFVSKNDTSFGPR